MAVKDTLLAVSGLLGGSGGGGGGSDQMKLLASGTYTAATAPNPLTIPVTYTGTPCYVFIHEDEILSDTAQVISAVRCFTAPYKELLDAYQDYVGIGSVKGYGLIYGRNSSNTKAAQILAANSSNLGNWTITSNAISFYRYSPTYPWAVNTYHWYIFGEEA